MVRYNDTITLKTPGASTWVDGKATFAATTTEDVECDVQPDSSGISASINGKTVVSKYKVFFKNNYLSVSTAKTVIYNGQEYEIVHVYVTQIDVQMKIG